MDVFALTQPLPEVDASETRCIQTPVRGVSGLYHSRVSRAWEPLWLVLSGFFLAAALVIVWRSPMPPMQDFCEWIYQSFVASNLLIHPTSALVPAAWKHWPVPNELSQTLMAALMLVFTPITAARIFLTCYLLGGAATLQRAALRCGGSAPSLLFFLLLPLLLVNTTFWTGEINYEVGLLLFLTYAVSDKTHRRRPRTLLVYSLLLFSAHALPFAFFFLFVSVDFWVDLKRDLKYERLVVGRRLAALFPACALALWYLLRDPRLDDATTFAPALHGPVQILTYRAYVFSKLGVYHNFVYGGAGDFLRNRSAYLAGSAVNVVAFFCFATIVVLYLVKAARARQLSPVFLLVAVCTAVGFLDPATLLHNANTGERFLLPAVALAVLSGGTGLWRMRAYAAVASLALVFLVSTAIRPPVYLPHAAATDETAINKPGERTHLLFWTRPYLFADGVEFAQHSALHQLPGPAPGLAFQTGMLLRSKLQLFMPGKQ